MDVGMPETRHIAVNGVRLAFDDVGHGPAILFVHGFMLDRTMWRQQVVALGGWRRIAPDLRGMGLSEAPERGYRMDVYADDLAALLEALDVERAVLCGLSMGGYVALEFLRRHRQRVRALVLLDTRAEADTAERKASRNDMIARVRHGEASALAEELATKFLAEGASADAKRRLKKMMDRTPPAGALGALEAMRDRPDSTPVLQSIGNVPTLVLIGRHDTRTPHASMQAIVDRIPDAMFEVISNAGHVPPLESPEETTRRLRRFLNGLESRSRSS
jgi:pimeloyl-ACP methyl ester carboxylesterase